MVLIVAIIIAFAFGILVNTGTQSGALGVAAMITSFLGTFVCCAHFENQSAILRELKKLNQRK
jgi:amino acid transporter